MNNTLLSLVSATGILAWSMAVANKTHTVWDRIGEVLWNNDVTSVYFAWGLPNGIIEWNGVSCMTQHMFDRTTGEPMELWIPNGIIDKNVRTNGEPHEVIWICEDSWKTDI